MVMGETWEKKNVWAIIVEGQWIGNEVMNESNEYGVECEER